MLRASRSCTHKPRKWHHSKLRGVANLAQLRERIPLDVHPEVEEAIQSGKPIVALESTIISHGMPYPHNMSTALSLESIIRQSGAVPATIALLKGRVKVGLTPTELETIARPRADDPVQKVSRRDLAPVVGLGKDGGTTIGGTMVLAALAGIKVFATGGLGGVHRGGETSWDVSADLTELGRTPVAVIAAGAKSILDIGRTLEYLETQGVMVATYGPTDDFPAFFTPISGFKSPWRVDNPIDAAKIIHSSHKLGLTSGQFFGVPIPASHHASGAMIQAAVDQAVRESEENGMSKRGKEVTPWLLKRIADLTRGESLKSNVALIENTTRVGGQIAAELSKLERAARPNNSQPGPSPFRSPNETPKSVTSPVQTDVKVKQRSPPQLVVLGAAAVDVTARSSKPRESAKESTSPGTVDITLGGVARNMAEAAHRRSQNPEATLLVSPVGDDAFATLLRDEIESTEMRTDGFFSPSRPSHGGVRTPVCNLLLDEVGELVGGVAHFEAVDIVEGHELVSKLNGDSLGLVAIDGNFPPPVIETVTRHCRQRGVPLWFEPTSTAKCTNIFPAVSSILSDEPFTTKSPPIAYASPNLIELGRMFEWAREHELLSTSSHWERVNSFGLGPDYRSQLERLARPAAPGDDVDLSFLIRDGVAQMAVSLLPFFQHLLVKCSSKGSFFIMLVNSSETGSTSWQTDLARSQIVVPTNIPGEHLIIKHFKPLKVSPKDVVSSTGAGDSLVGSLLADITSFGGETVFKDPTRLEAAFERARQAAVLSLKSAKAVSPLLSA